MEQIWKRFRLEEAKAEIQRVIVDQTVITKYKTRAFLNLLNFIILIILAITKDLIRYNFREIKIIYLFEIFIID